MNRPPTNKQIGLLGWIIRKYRNHLPRSKRNTDKVNHDIADFEEYSKTKDIIEVGDLIRILQDEAIPEENKLKELDRFLEDYIWWNQQEKLIIRD